MKRWLNLGWAVVALVVGMAPGAAAVDTQALEALAKRFWAAEVQQDYQTVYDILASGEQNAVTRDNYVTLRKEGKGSVRYLAAEVGKIEFLGDLAWVHVKLEWMFLRAPKPGRPFETWHLWRYGDGWHPVAPDERDRWPILPPSLRPAADEAALTQRTTGLWKAKAEQDWKSVYGYLPPEYRARVPLEQFLKSKSRLLYITPHVEWVEVKGSEAHARIGYLYKINDPAVSKMQPVDQEVTEPWVKVDGNWYLNTSALDEPPAKKSE
jgi:hypothetical protein